MLSLLLVLIPFILYTIYPILDFRVSQINKYALKDTCYNPNMRKDICYNNKIIQCPISSYKQCTNNNYPINKCDCYEKSYELCNRNNQYSEKCYYKNISKFPDLHIISDNPNKNNRVNMYHGQASHYHFLK